MKYISFLPVVYFALSVFSPLIGEDIVDLRKKIPAPSMIKGGTVNIENGHIDLHPPYLAHFIENEDGSFQFLVNLTFRDSTPREIVTGRIEVNLYREIGEYGSMDWQLFWAGTREVGSAVRQPRLVDQVRLPFKSNPLVQTEPLVRYRVEMKASTHGTKGRHKRLDYIFSAVRVVKKGRIESALGLLLSTEASLVYRHFHSIFSELAQRDINRREARFAISRFHYAIRRFNHLVQTIPGNYLLNDRFTFSHTIVTNAARLAGIAPLKKADFALPWYFILDREIVQAYRRIAIENTIDFEKAALASEKIARAIQRYAYEGKWSVENLNNELYEAERMLVLSQDSYEKTLLKAHDDFTKLTSKFIWAPADTIPEQKYLNKVKCRGKRFFNIPRYVAFIEVNVLQAIRAINGS